LASADDVANREIGGRRGLFSGFVFEEFYLAEAFFGFGFGFVGATEIFFAVVA
jgi:hypothetical protein